MLPNSIKIRKYERRMYECKVRKCTILHLQKQGVLHIFASVVFDSLALTLCNFITYIENIVKRLSEMAKNGIGKHPN